MINKIRELIRENRAYHQQILMQTKELEWAHIYHDSIRGNKPIESLGLNIGRWAGNYAFFYVLNRLLSDYKPSAILELGLGESTKFISTYLDNYLPDSNHIVVEHSQEWLETFSARFKLSSQTEVIICPLEIKKINGHEVNIYSNFDEKINSNFDLYILDGPFGSPRYSRYEIVSIIKKFDSKKAFIIVFDDTDRQGEKDTLNEVVNLLNLKGIKNHIGHYSGNKRVTLIVSNEYINALSL